MIQTYYFHLLFCEKGSSLKGKEFAPPGANSFLEEWTTFGRATSILQTNKNKFMLFLLVKWIENIERLAINDNIILGKEAGSVC